MLSNEIGVVIVNYNSFELCVKCIESLIRHSVAVKENIVIVDNCSPDGSGSLLRNTLTGCHVVSTKMNNGYGYGVNYGVKYLSTDYILILNPDTYFFDNPIERILDQVSSDKSIGIVGLDLIYPDGSRQFSGRKFYSFLDILVRRTPLKSLPLFSKINQRHLMVSYWNQCKFEADWVLGTGMLVKRSVFNEVGGMDDSFFMYMEDVDLCRRVWAFGKKVLVFPEFN